MEFTLKQAQDLVESFGGDEETTMTVKAPDKGHSGPGLYVFATDYPDEGSMLLGEPAESVRP